MNGQTPDWNVLHRDEPVGRVPLPSYPFEHKKFWIAPDGEPIRQIAVAEPAHEKETIPGEVAGEPPLRFYKRVWKQTDFPSVTASAPACWLIFVDEKGLGKQICTQLRGAGHKVVFVSPGKSYRRSGSSDYSVRLSVPADYQALLEDLVSAATLRKRSSISGPLVRAPLEDPLKKNWIILFSACSILPKP